MINTLKHLAFVLKVRPHELEEMILNLDKYYYEKKEKKFDAKRNIVMDRWGNEKIRILHPSIKKLKVIQKKIQRNILSKLPMPDYAYGGVRGRDNIKNAKRHQGKRHFFTTDLKDFYPSITNSKVFKMFRSFNFSPSVCRILTQLTTYKGRLPQGTPTSSTIANLVFIKTGNKLQTFAIQNGLTFTSFVDDLTFSAPYDFKEKSNCLLDVIKADGFLISHKKTNYKTKNPMVTGIIVKNNNLDLPTNFKGKLIDSINYSETQIKGLKLYIDRVLTT